jgi:hypothetical protein
LEETIMRKMVLAAATLAALVAGGTLFSGSASAIDFVIGGHRHCWAGDGWHGAGWYWCGYEHRRGHGWGGPEGYHGWHHD